MRSTLRLLASVKPVAARYLEAGAPTGLTGLLSNPSPRSALLYLYSTTLDRLQAGGVPETSLYRQSVEAVTRQRLAAVQAVAPAGYDEWLARARDLLARHPDRFDAFDRPLADGSSAAGVERGGRFFVLRRAAPDVDERYQEWDGEPDNGGELEGTRTSEERRDQVELAKDPFDGKDVEWEDEPQLTVDQIEELENKIGAGLIEEVIQVAEGELKLVDTMIQGKVWESLDEKPREGQWKYFERKE